MVGGEWWVCKRVRVFRLTSPGRRSRVTIWFHSSSTISPLPPIPSLPLPLPLRVPPPLREVVVAWDDDDDDDDEDEDEDAAGQL